LPQAPQLSGSLVVLLQPLAQHDCPTPHGGPPAHVVAIVQLKFWQIPLGQTMPHPPQFCGSSSVATHPVGRQQVWSGAQLHCGVVHVCCVQHCPSTHWAVPGGQTRPQPPQLLRSFVVSVQAPSQQPKPSGHGPHTGGGIEMHMPSSHAPPSGHTTPQPPQLVLSLRVSVHPSGQHVSENEQPAMLQVCEGGSH
jgi:hypothetical protein